MSQDTDAYKMTKMIADATPEQRQAMLTERLKMISSQPEEQRVQSVKGMVIGMSKLDSKRRATFLVALAEALSERSEEEREAIYLGRAKAGLLLLKEVDNSVYQGMVDAVFDWPQDRRQKILGELEKAHEKLNLVKPDFQLMIEKAKAEI
ncbi:MAG: hypothetical protein ACTSV9_02540 [Candidatus Thorarchaeota archaeon]